MACRENVIYSIRFSSPIFFTMATIPCTALVSRFLLLCAFSSRIKMVLSGEGADEVFGGYLYFHKAPTPQAFHEETVRKLSKLHMYDCLRANKSLSAPSPLNTILIPIDLMTRANKYMGVEARTVVTSYVSMK